MTQDYKHPRIFLNAALSENALIALEKEQTHYFRNVLRKKQGDYLRVFNGKDGEYLATIKEQGKKSTNIELGQKIRAQTKPSKRLSLYFSPIKSARLATLIEKSVELGATDLYPVITERTENRHFKEDKIRSQIVEAAEQCERLDLPLFHESQKFDNFAGALDRLVLAAIERQEALPLKEVSDEKGDLAFLIGPEGGFTAEEIHTIETNDYLIPVTLGENILRSETAAIACLAWARLSF